MKKLFKGLRRIKWENIIAILMTCLMFYVLYCHIMLNGLYFELLFEIPMDLISIIGIRYLVLDIRKNPKNWLFD